MKKLLNYIKDDNISYETKTHLCRLLIEKIELDGENLEITMIVPIERKEIDETLEWSL